MNLLDRLGLSVEDAGKPVSTYSGGMKRNLGHTFARQNWRESNNRCVLLMPGLDVGCVRGQGI